MKEAILIALFIASLFGAKAQTAPAETEYKTAKEAKTAKRSFGIKAGYNVAKVTGSTPDYKPDAKNGFMVSAFFAPRAKTGIGYRSEIVFSRQGFGFEEGGKTSSVTSDYVYMPQFTTIGITKYVQLQAGGQIGYLIKSSKESASDKKLDITSLANRIDYGAAFGVEIYPVKNLIIGGRYNFSMGDTYKQPSATPSPLEMMNPLPFNPSEVKSKNAVINFYVGFTF